MSFSDLAGILFFSNEDCERIKSEFLSASVIQRIFIIHTCSRIDFSYQNNFFNIGIKYLLPEGSGLVTVRS